MKSLPCRIKISRGVGKPRSNPTHVISLWPSLLVVDAMSRKLVLAARSAKQALDNLTEELASSDFTHLLPQIGGLVNILQDTFDLSSVKGLSTFDKLAKAKDHAKYLTKKVKKRHLEIARLQGRRVGGRIHTSWLIRAGLSLPSLPVASVSSYLRDFPADEAHAISPTYVGVAKDAFCELVKDFNAKEISNLCSSMTEIWPRAVAAPWVPIVVVHVHDEASMRVRSFLDDTHPELTRPASKRIVRTRYSKVMNHAVWVCVGSKALEHYTELHAVHRKDAPTIAKSLHDAFSPIVNAVQASKPPDLAPGQRARILHILTGDGVGTNLAAAKRLWQKMEAGTSDTTYRIVNLICGSHIANLVVKAAVLGGRSYKKPEKESDICCALSRLCKHLLPYYSEEFGRNLMNAVVDNFSTEVGGPNPDHERYVSNLRGLYGQDIINDDIVRLLNHSFDPWSHRGPEDPADDIRARRGRLHASLFKLILRPEEKPCVTRFWTFGEGVRILLRADILRVPINIYAPVSSSPTPDNKVRLEGFKAFASAPSTPPRLRSLAMALQLSDIALNISAKQPDQFLLEHDADEPALVRLGSGEVQARSSKRLCEILALLSSGADPLADVASACFTLLLTQLHIVSRFSMYYTFPYALWRLSRRYNGDDCAVACSKFLTSAERLLDVGYCLPLQREALSLPGREAAIAYLLGDSVQREIDQIVTQGAATSLEVERRHQQSKRAEKCKVVSLARASRDSLLQRYHVRRSRCVIQTIQSKKQALKLKSMNARAVAISRQPALFSRARGHLKWQAPSSSSSKKQIVHKGDGKALNAYIEEHRPDLEAEAKRLRENGKELSSSISDNVEFPLRNAQWMQWIETHEAKFREALKTASKERQARSACLSASDAEFPAAPRLQPALQRLPMTAWQAVLLHQDPGFFLVKGSPGEDQLRVFFAATVRGDLWAYALPQVRHRTCGISTESSFEKEITLLPSLSQLWGVSDSAEVYRVELAHAKDVAIEGFLALFVESATKVAPRKKRRNPRPDEDPEPVDADAEPAHRSEHHDDISDGASDDAFSIASSSIDSVLSDVESGVEDEDAKSANSSSSDEGEEAEGPIEEADVDPRGDAARRAIAGTHTESRDGYFTYTDNRDYPDVKVLVHSKWCTRDMMGKKAKSRTLTPRRYGESRENPVVCMLALRAWAIHRVNAHGFVGKHRSRLAWQEAQVSALRRDIVALGFGGAATGYAKLDKLIRGWAPQVLHSV